MGSFCRLDISSWGTTDLSGADAAFAATVTGYVIGSQKHMEDENRTLFYFHCTSVEYPAAVQQALRRRRALGGGAGELTSRAAAGGGGSSPLVSAPIHSGSTGDYWLNELSVSTGGFTSSAGYKYRFDGWFEEVFLYPIEGERLEPIPADWIHSMREATAACEVRLLCYAFQPWFDSPFHTLRYLALPERDVCYSVWLCHRCLTPFFSHPHLAVHLEGYCGQATPPGLRIYADPVSGLEVRYVDGAQHLHYGRSLALLGKCFLESKLLLNDSDVYEFFVLTLPRAALPYIPGDSFASEAAFRAEAAAYDARGWTGHVVAGYFSRVKHRPHHTLSCILTLPMFQQLRLGTFMLDVAYALMEERQRQCGCARFCGPRRCDGGAVSRPYSPHGQVLLLSYWRRALLRVLWAREQERRQQQRQQEGMAAGPSAVAGDEATTFPAFAESLRFASVRELAAAMEIPIAVDDLAFLLINDHFAFYAPIDGGRGGAKVAIPTGPRGKLDEGEGASATYQLSLIFDTSQIEKYVLEQERARAEDEQRILCNNGRWASAECIAAHIRRGFRAEYLCRDAHGKLVYSRSLFHY